MMASLKQFHLRPDVSSASAANYGAEFFGLKLAGECRPKELCSYDDRNFLLVGKLPQDQEDKSYVLKVMNSRDSYDAGFIDAMDAAMIHFCQNNKEFACPIPVKSLSGQLRDSIELPIVDPMKCFGAYYIGDEELTVGKIKEIAKADPLVRTEERPDGSTQFYMVHYIRLLTFVPGKPLGDLQHIDSDLLWNCGVLVAKVQKTLEGFHHPALKDRKHLWNISYAGNLLPLLDKSDFMGQTEKELIRAELAHFQNKVIPRLAQQSTQTVHTDLNGSNILTQVQSGIVVLTGIIDFGDIMDGCWLLEVGIAACYAALLRPHAPLEVILLLLDGYQSVLPLTQDDIDLVYCIVRARLAQSALIGHYNQRELARKDDYVMKDAKKALHVLAIINENH